MAELNPVFYAGVVNEHGHFYYSKNVFLGDYDIVNLN